MMFNGNKSVQGLATCLATALLITPIAAIGQTDREPDALMAVAREVGLNVRALRSAIERTARDGEVDPLARLAPLPRSVRAIQLPGSSDVLLAEQPGAGEQTAFRTVLTDQLVLGSVDNETLGSLSRLSLPGGSRGALSDSGTTSIGPNTVGRRVDLSGRTPIPDPGVALAPGDPAVIGSAPQLPGAPIVPTVPGFPTVPGLPSVPSFPGAGTPSLPLPSTPSLPNLPSTPSLPNLPNIPTVPNLPAVPRVTNLPAVPRVTNTPAVPRVTNTPTLPRLPASNSGSAFSLPARPNLSGTIGTLRL